MVSLEMHARLEKWRAVLEPLAAEAVTPAPWSDVQSKALGLFERGSSVLVTRGGMAFGEPACLIWLAAGELEDVMDLAAQAENAARHAGYKRMMFLGRPGWIKHAGYKQQAVIGTKEIEQ